MIAIAWVTKFTYRDRKNYDSQRRDRILRLFLRPEIGQFSPHFGAISLLNCTQDLEKKEKNPLEKIQKVHSGETSRKLRISVPCRGRTCPGLNVYFWGDHVYLWEIKAYLRLRGLGNFGRSKSFLFPKGRSWSQGLQTYLNYEYLFLFRI